MTEQARCPEPGCIYGLPDDDPDAHGWGYFSDLWWCPLHAFGEYRRIKKQEETVDWYDQQIRQREQVITDSEAEREQALARIRAARRDRKHPEPDDEERRTQQRLSQLGQVLGRTKFELTTLRQNRGAEVFRQRKQNEQMNNLRPRGESAEEDS